MRKQTGIIAITTLLFTLLLQGCGSAAADGQGNTGSDSLSSSGASSSSDAAPTLTFTGFAVVQQGKALSGKVVAFFSEDMDASSVNVNTFKITSVAGKPVPGEVQYIGVTAVFTPNQRFDAQTSYTATLTTGVRSLSGVPLAREHSWTFTTPSPSELTGVLTSITSTEPRADQTDVALNAGVNVSFHQLMDPATINPSTITVTDADGDVVTGKVHYSGLSASFLPNGSLEPNTTYKARVSAQASSLSGVPMDADKIWTFTTGADSTVTAPQVVYTAPMIGDINVAPDATLVMNFNMAMDTNTVNTSSVTLHDSNGTAVDGNVVYSGDTAVFTPDAPLLPNTTYTATVNTSALSTGGTAMQQGYDWTFTTGTGVAPTVLFANPSSYESKAGLDSAISAAFDQQLDASSISTATVQVVAPDGSTVSGTVTCISDVLSFMPDQPLQASTSYTVTLTTGIRDTAGGYLAQPFVWTFTTMQPVSL
jgi:hypothetical protein